MHVRSLLFQTANGTGINPAVRLKGHSAKLPGGLWLAGVSPEALRHGPFAPLCAPFAFPGVPPARKELLTTTAIQRALDELTQVQHKAAESLYRQQSAGGGAAGGGPAGGDGASTGSGQASGTQGGSAKPAGDVIDAEVVDEGKA